MGVQQTATEGIEEAPATPPGVRDLTDVDLFAQTDEMQTLTAYNNELKDILQVLPYIGSFDFIGGQDTTDILGLQFPTIKNKDDYCPRCTGDPTRASKWVEKFVQECKNETDHLRTENESLKKELEQLKASLYKDDNNRANVSISVEDRGNVDVWMRKNSFEHIRKSDVPEHTPVCGVQRVSVTVPRDDIFHTSNKDYLTGFQSECRKSIVQLRKKFFEQNFASEQKVFKSQTYLEVKPVNNEPTVRSRLTIRVKPKPRVAAIISKLSSLSTASRHIPEVAPVRMFQRFEKTKIVWQDDKKIFVS